jgi:phage protein D
MFTIQVIESSTGKPAYYKKVSVGFKGWDRGFSKDQYTDRNGEAHFSEDNGNGIIYVQGTKVYEGRIEGRKVIYI